METGAQKQICVEYNDNSNGGSLSELINKQASGNRSEILSSTSYQVMGARGKRLDKITDLSTRQF
jgi:hypothetical protein